MLVPARSRVTLVDVLTWRAGAAAGALAAVALAVVAWSGPAAAAGPAASVGAGEVVGGPDLGSRGIVVRPAAGSTPLPTIDADTWLVADLTTGQVLAAKGAHTRVLPASTLKTLTSVTLMPKLDPSTVVTASEFDVHAVGSHVGLVVGGTYTVRDLWNALLLPSANDAASALAEADGGFAKTVAEMTQMAHHLQADDTTPKTPSGLDTPGQLSSAYDMALIARAALQIPDFNTVTMTMNYDFPGKPVAPGATRSTYKIYTENRLLRHHYRGTIGGKTGFTSLAHRTFWGAASRGGHTIVVTLFQIHEPTETAARKLLDWGFVNTGRVTPVGTLVAPLADAATSDPAASPATGGGGPTNASGRSSTAAAALPWKKVGLALTVLVGLGVGLLWWRRRAGDPADPGARPASPADPLDDRPAEPRPQVRPAAVRTSSVVVSGPHGTAPEPLPTSDAAPGPVSVQVAASVQVGPTDGAEAPTDTAPVEPDAAATPPPPVPAPVADAPVATPPVAPPGSGNVRVITPPSRPSDS